ncbi:MAG: LemA family protein [Acidimicrobiia bacterium]|nr:LemA family protein [Acidimicrobiia bacterium]
MLWVVIVILVLVVVVVLGLVGLYNGLVKRRNRVDAAWSDIDVQLRRRYDLIPNLVETVRGYAAHESQTLEAVIAARAQGMSAQTPREAAAADNMLTAALRQLLAVSEAYPDLKANQNFLALQEELTGTEGRIAYARQYYNDAVRDYNTKIQSFPAVLIAGMFKFGEREYYEIEDAEARGPVSVDFGTQAPAVNMAPQAGPPPATPAVPQSPAASQLPPQDPPASPPQPPSAPT